MIDRRAALALGAGGMLVGIPSAGTPAARREGIGTADPDAVMPLWPKGAPGAPRILPVETVTERSTDPAVRDRAMTGVVRPRLDVFHPAASNGAAVLLVPGGGFARITIDKTGYVVGRWLAARGYTAFVLFYRLPGDGWAAGPDVALSDAQRAMRLIRARAPRLGVDPAKVATIGFSAGGHVCADLATRWGLQTYAPVDAADRHDARPAATALLYAVQSMSAPLAHAESRALLLGNAASEGLERTHSPSRNVTRATPPCFLAHAEDDPAVPVGNTLEMRAALRAANVPVETHLFVRGGHGFALGDGTGQTASAWIALFHDWLRFHGLG